MNSKYIKHAHTTNEIESVRSELIATGIKKGLNHPATILLSIKLDNLLNQYRLKEP
jgi:hypothetical protein